MHPSVLAEAYHRNYTPYLLGQKGATSLTHYFGMAQIHSQMRNKQAVYFVSPQWFVKKGESPAAFQSYFSSGQLIDFLQQQTGSLYDRYAAKRFLTMYPNASLKDLVEKVASGKSLSTSDKRRLSVADLIYQKEDNLFGQFSLRNVYQQKIVSQAKTLPNTFSYDQLEKQAIQLGQKETRNNSFGIKDSFYQSRIGFQLKKLKGSQAHFSYLKSPEYNDLQLVLNQFAKNHTNVLFIIPPVNSKWVAYTGLDTKMYQKTVAKIKYQLQSQGFTNIVDLSKDGAKPYFMQDTIHMGWSGWLAMDKAVEPFLTNPRPAPNYTIQDQFLSKEWANTTSIGK
ncbi:D-alanine transfer protein [Streptococcus saliviloxodontae]|uniref:D-alanine transfer protein n=2 Tax=Streptococcus saliviloxodontae TaxID=1349416 RepID=A0ABS2PIR3_9STRE|nr:D-alanine transfer protein [Streptococcus saliviloxodontae]